MDNLFIKKPYARTEIIDRKHVEQEGLRLHQLSRFDISLQIRTRTEKQGRMTAVNLTRQECLAVAEWLNAQAHQLEDE